MRGLGSRVPLVPEVEVEEVKQEGDRNAGSGRDLAWRGIHLRRIDGRTGDRSGHNGGGQFTSPTPQAPCVVPMAAVAMSLMVMTPVMRCATT